MEFGLAPLRVLDEPTGLLDPENRRAPGGQEPAQIPLTTPGVQNVLARQVPDHANIVGLSRFLRPKSPSGSQAAGNSSLTAS